MAENNAIPANAENILFAEDLMKYMMLEIALVQYPPSSLEQLRGVLYNAFNEDTQAAFYNLYNRMRFSFNELFVTLQSNMPYFNSTVYMNFVEEKDFIYFTEGENFEGENFLLYCVHLTTMAVFFYNMGVREAPCLAVYSIVRALERFDMSNGGWAALEETVAEFASLGPDSINGSSVDLDQENPTDESN